MTDLNSFHQRMAALETSLEQNKPHLKQDLEQLKVDFELAYPKGDFLNFLSKPLRDAFQQPPTVSRYDRLGSLKASLCNTWGITYDVLNATFLDYSSTTFLSDMKKVAALLDWNPVVDHLMVEREKRMNS
ncbi:hypothetical protein UCDDS831_g00931 [Diplodia seriata]|uniref:Uncharacterized protein n=1 Tax=Diplodia seriata TaxID=420778 RepID=A0A0G2EYE7_9PEZI|nr:hypothetical protein UCDDS831_g00931 [Diplodia seriata]